MLNFFCLDNWKSGKEQTSGARTVHPCPANGYRMHSKWNQSGVAQC